MKLLPSQFRENLLISVNIVNNSKVTSIEIAILRAECRDDDRWLGNNIGVNDPETRAAKLICYNRMIEKRDAVRFRRSSKKSS